MKKLAVLIICCITSLQCLQAQSLEERLSRHKPSCSDVFSNAMDVLPEMYAAKTFDSMQLVIDFIDKNCGTIVESFDLKLLLDIEQGRFRAEDNFDSLSINNLTVRAERYSYQRKYSRDSTGDQAKFYRFTAMWANDLLKKDSTDKNQTLVLKVLAGKVQDPVAFLKKNKAAYSYLYQLTRADERAERKGPRALLSLVAGVWIPTNNLSVLGTHPTFGLQIGMGKGRNEFDLTAQAKFINAANDYTVLRQNTLYTRNYFSGVFLGLDYTRYLLQGSKAELGWLAGIAYDAFNISNSSDKENDYLDPQSIESFNLNTGLRFNYYLKKGNMIGLAGRYNMVNYKNEGGSSFKGDIVSIDLIFAMTGRRGRWLY